MFTKSKQLANGSAADRRLFGRRFEPGWAHMVAPPPMAADWEGFQPPTEKTAVGCATIRP